MLKLKVDSIELEFDGRKVLQDISLHCSQGEIVGLLGRNGSGKSSLLKIIFGTLTPTHKYVSIGGQFIIKGYQNNKIAYLPQHNYLPPGVRIKNMAKMLVAPSHWVEFTTHPVYQDHSYKKVHQLSGGELRQLEMLMVLYSRADFILLDEPFTHVTPVQSDYFKPVIKAISRHKGVIITDHQYHNVMDISDRIIILTEGCTKPVSGLNDLVTYNYLSGNNQIKMTITIYQADAFTNRLFGGNPAAICPLDKWLPDETMQQIATENNLAETAFFVAEGDGYKLRWFTPEFEIDLCGHATLASAHIIFTELGYTKDTIHFETVKAGVLTVKKDGDKYTMDFPSRPPIGIEMPNGLAEALGGKEPIAILRSRDYFLVYESEDDILELNPDFSALSKFDTVGFIVTAKGKQADFVSRFFAPGAGIPEDPVTGSAHCNLIPYWAEKLGKSKLHAYQLSARKGELWCELHGERVLMSGNAVTYLKGEIFV